MNPRDMCGKLGIGSTELVKGKALLRVNDPPPTPYPELNRVLRELVDSLQEILHGQLVGAYLQGSFAVGDFDEHSDCDFIVVTEQELSGDEVAALQRMHERIYALPIAWAQHLEGSYFAKPILRSYARSGEKLWYLDHGSRSLERSEHCNTILVRWVVREFGVVLHGPPPDSLVDSIPVGLLREEIAGTMRDWGRAILADPEPYNNRFYQGFIVLSYCRMLHDLLRGRPGSKRAGAEWAKANLEPRWMGLIDRAWGTRPDPAVSVRTPANPEDFRATMEFLGYMIDRAGALHDALRQ